MMKRLFLFLFLMMAVCPAFAQVSPQTNSQFMATPSSGTGYLGLRAITPLDFNNGTGASGSTCLSGLLTWITCSGINSITATSPLHGAVSGNTLSIQYDPLRSSVNTVPASNIQPLSNILGISAPINSLTDPNMSSALLNAALPSGTATALGYPGGITLGAAIAGMGITNIRVPTYMQQNTGATATCTGTISGTTLTCTSGGPLTAGMYVTDGNVIPNGTTISGSASPWTLSQSSTSGATGVQVNGWSMSNCWLKDVINNNSYGLNILWTLEGYDSLEPGNSYQGLPATPRSLADFANFTTAFASHNWGTACTVSNPVTPWYEIFNEPSNPQGGAAGNATLGAGQLYVNLVNTVAQSLYKANPQANVVTSGLGGTPSVTLETSFLQLINSPVFPTPVGIKLNGLANHYYLYGPNYNTDPEVGLLPGSSSGLSGVANYRNSLDVFYPNYITEGAYSPYDDPQCFSAHSAACTQAQISTNNYTWQAMMTVRYILCNWTQAPGGLATPGGAPTPGAIYMFSAISQGSPAEGIVSNLGIGSTFSAGDVQTYTMVKTLMAQTAGMKMTGYSIDSATTSTGALNSIRLEAPNKTTYIVWLRIGDSAYAINNLPSTATVTGPTGTNLTSGIVSGSYSVTPPTLTSPQGPIYISY